MGKKRPKPRPKPRPKKSPIEKLGWSGKSADIQLKGDCQPSGSNIGYGDAIVKGIMDDPSIYQGIEADPRDSDG